MKHSVKAYWCGPAALQNALLVLGDRVGQHRIAELSGTTEDGTDEYDLIRAIGLLGYKPDMFATDDRQEAWLWLRDWPVRGVPLLICVDNWRHWVTITGRCGDRLNLEDPEQHDAPYNMSQNGVWKPKTESVLRRWKASLRTRVTMVEEGEPKGPKWFGIGIHK